MIVVSNIHNLGDFILCLPVLSGLVKKNKQKMVLVIHSSLRRFREIRELLLFQNLFDFVFFSDEILETAQSYIVAKNDQEIVRINAETFSLNDTSYAVSDFRPYYVQRYYENFVNQYSINFEVDDDFVLNAPDYNLEFEEKIIVGDRNSPELNPLIDMRRIPEPIKKSNQLSSDKFHFLDYTKGLMTNCSIIKNSKKPFISTFTGMGMIGDLLHKECIITWGEDLRNWVGYPIEYTYRMFFYANRKSKLIYINDLENYLKMRE